MPVPAPAQPPPATELNLQGRGAALLLEQTARALAALRADEQHLRRLMADYREAQTRPPEDRWWEARDARFGEELYQSRVEAALQGVGETIGVEGMIGVGETIGVEENANAPNSSVAEWCGGTDVE